MRSFQYCCTVALLWAQLQCERSKCNTQNAGKELIQHLPATGHPGKVTSIHLVNLLSDPMLYVHFLFSPQDPQRLHAFSLSSSLVALNLIVQAFIRNEKKIMKGSGKRFTTRKCLGHIHVINHRSLNWPVSKLLFSKRNSLCSSYQEWLH